MEFNETDIAIIGMNCRFPGINGIEAFESCLRSGKGLLDPQLKQGEGGNTRICINAVIDEIDQFDAELFGFTHQEARITDPQQRLFMQAVWEMLETSGYAPRHIDQTTGIFAGTSTSFYLLYHLLGQTNDIRQANDLQVMIGNDKDHLTSQIAYRLDVKGPTVTIQASCATSMVATHLACEALNSGQCDLAISGGVTLRLPSQKDYDFQSGGLLSEDGLIHAFDAEATGTVYSSGVATLLLKRAQDAINDGDQIHGLILGTAVTNDGAMRAGYTAPSVDGQVRALVEAYEIAGVDPADIAYVEAHGSGTPMGDRIELDALHQVFGQFSNRSVTPKSCVLGSVKTNIGHCEMASGAAGLIKTILSLRSSTLFPSLNFSVPAPELAQAQSPFYVNVSCKPWPQHRPRLAGVSSIGLGGTNAHTILKAYEPSQVAGTQTDHVGSELIVLSAREQDQLHAYQEALINSADRFSLKDIAHTLRVGREAHSLRKAVVLNSGQSLKDALHAASEVQATEKQFYLMLSPQVAFSSDEMNEFLQMMSERATEIADMSDNSDLLTRYDTLSRDQQEALTAQLILNFLHYLDVTPAAILLNADRSSAGALWSVVESFVAELPCFYRDKTAWIPFEGRSHFENLSKIAQQLETSEPYIFALGQALVINYDSDTNCINIGMDAYSISGQSPIEIFDYPIFSTDNLLRTRQLIEGLGHAWANGVRINWHQFPTQSDVCRVPLPSPQFLQRSYWIDQPDQTSVLEISKLPERAVQLGIVKMAPQEVFDSVKQIWEQAFGTEIDDDQINFFEMGGHSLMATQMISLLQERIGVNLPMSAFFEAPTIAGIAKACQNQQSHHQASNFQTLIQEPDQLNEPFALTDVQLAYWIGRRSSLPLGDVATHIYFEFDLPEFSLPLFEVAVNKVIARHPMLRAVIREDGMQQILAQVPVFKIQDIPADDINSIAYQSATKRLRSKMSHQVTDCSQWPLFDMCAVTTQTGHARLHVSFDLLIADAWSIELFMQEVSYHYRHPNADLPELGFSFRDHVMTTKQAEKSEAFDIARAYWETRLPELPMGPDLPLQTAPENLSGVKFVRRSQVMSSAVMSRLKQLASQHQLTMTGLLLSCFSIVLARWSREPHFCLNLTLFNRSMMHPDVNQVIGDFTTLNIMEIDLRGNDSFLMKAQRVQQQIWQDLDHRLFSGVQVSRRLSQRGEQAQDGIIPVVFTSLLNQDNVEWNEQDEALLGANDFYTISQTPQVWLDHQVMEREGKLYLNWDAVEELFEPAMLDEMFAAYIELIEELALNPSLLEATNLPRLPAVATAIQRCALPTSGLHDALANYARETPHATAIWQANAAGECLAEISYDQLNRAANRVAITLQSGGVVQEEIIAIVMEKGWEQSAAAHGILKSGGAYLPIDPGLPKQRQQELLTIAQVRHILTQPQYAADLVDLPQTVHVVSSDWQSCNQPFEAKSAHPEQTAYVIFTSGSTGTPKGVVISHQAVMNTIEDICTRRELTETDGVFGLSSLSFDLSVFDLFGTTARGARLVLPHPEGLKDPRHWERVLQAGGVTVWNSVPALLRMLTIHEQDRSGVFPQLRVAMLSGDWIPLSLPEDAWQSLNREMKIYSLGGATEASIWSIEYEIESVDKNWQSIPYGIGLTNQPMRVMTAGLQECPVGVVGEIVIGGDGLAQGYLGRKDLTEKSFVIHPETEERLYKTGDLGRYDRDGVIEFLGRIDNQVKINGHRVELGEVEAVLEKHNKIRQVKVMTRGVGDGASLVAFIETDELLSDQEIDPAIIKDPAQRLAFKLEQHGIRRLDGKRIAFTPPKQSDVRFVRRRSCRSYSEQLVTKAQFQQVLQSLSQCSFDKLPFPKYRYGSAGGLYPVQIYIGIHPNKVEGIPSGLYYHDPRNNELVAVGDRPDGRVSGQSGPNIGLIESSAFAMYFVSNKSAIEPMYGQKMGEIFAAMEVGAICQMLEEEAANLDMGFCQLGAMDDRDLRRALELNDDYQVLHCSVAGVVPEQMHNQEAMFKDFSKYEKQPRLDIASEQNFDQALKDYLQESLPAYMVPSRIVACRHMPLTANGKIDNKALLAQLEDNQANHGGLVGNHQPAELERSMAIFAGSPINQIKADELESKVLDWWREALGGLEVGVQDSFFDIGGTSLELVRVHRSMEQEMRMEIPIVDLFRLATPKDVVHYLMNLKSEMTQPEIAPSVTKPGSNDFKASRAALLARCQNS